MDAVEDALSHLLMSLETREEANLGTLLLGFVVENEKLADRNNKSIREV